MKREFATVMAALALTLASAAEQSGIAEMHRQWLDAAMERYITYEGWAFGAQPNGWFAAVAGKYAQTNQLPFDGVVLLVQEKLEKEYDAFRNGAPPPDDGTGEERKARVDMSVNMLRSLGRKPLSLPFLYRMSRKAEGHYRRVFEDMFYETVAKSPVSAIRSVLDTHEKLVADANGLARALSAHALASEESAVDELLLTILPDITDSDILMLWADRRLCDRYPEYKTSLQRLATWNKLRDYEPPDHWSDEGKKSVMEQKDEFTRFVALSPEKRTDMRQRFKNLPPPAPTEKEE